MHEETFSLCGSLEAQSSPSKVQEYNRSYWAKNNAKLNQAKRRNRQVKKELDLNGNVSPMFESAARPSKAEQQTVENLSKTFDKSSLSNLDGEASNELNDSSQSYCQKDQMSVVTSRPEKAIREKSSNPDIQNQAELLLEIRDCLIDLRESVKPAAQSMPVEQEQQAIVGGIANANSGKLPKTADNEKRDFLSGVLSQLGKLDGASFIRNFPAALALGYCAYLACGFVIDQTLPLYRSLNFPMPELACSGAIGLAIGFSALSVISKSNMAKIFIAIIAAYELILVFAGSQANQADIALQALRDNPEHFEASQSYAIAKGDFERYNANYGSNNSKMLGYFERSCSQKQDRV